MKYTVLILGLLAISVCAHGQQFTYFQCDPVSCQESLSLVHNGDVGVDGYGNCSNYMGLLEVHPNAAAHNCLGLVDLAAIVTRSTTMTIDDCNQVLYTDRMSGNGGAFFAEFPYWQMYEKRGCDGEYDDYVQPQAPC